MNTVGKTDTVNVGNVIMFMNVQSEVERDKNAE